MNTLIDLAIGNRKLFITLLVLIILSGLNAYVSITKEQQPEVDFPAFFITISHDGISPEDAEQLLIKPIELHLRNIEGVKEIDAFGREGGALIIAEFYTNIEQNDARREVREAVDMGKPRLPEDAREPVITEATTSDNPVIQIVLYGDLPVPVMSRVIKNAREELEANPYLREATTSGERDQMLEVLVDPAKLRAYQISPTELFQIVTNNNRLIAAGSLDTKAGRFAVRVDGLLETADDVLSLPVKTSRDGVVTLRDVTTVRRTFKEALSLARYNGKPAYTLGVIKQQDANAVDASDAAKATIDKLLPTWPEGVQVAYLFDQKKIVNDFMGTLQNNVTSAIVLVAVIVVGALGMRPALLVGISVPGSFLFGILCLYFAGFSINNVVMFGLILSVGLLVDGAIVVTEYADRKMLEGLDRVAAYRLAAKRMAMPILSSTLTTVAAFLPLIFWPGVMGSFMSYVPVTVIYTLIGSFIMAMIFLPTVGASIGKAVAVDGDQKEEQMKALSHDHEFNISNLRGATRYYAEILEAVVRNPWRVIAGSSFLAAVIIYGYATAGLGSRTFSDQDPPMVQLMVHARGNHSIEELEEKVALVTDRVADIEGIDAIWSNTYIRNSNVQGADDIVGQVNLMLKDWFERRPYELIKTELRERIKDVPGLQVRLSELQFGPIRGKDIQIKLTAANPDLLPPVVNALKDRMLQIDGVIELDDSLNIPGIDWAIDVDRTEAGRYGTNVSTVGAFIQLMTNGMLASRYRPQDSIEEEDIRIRMPAGDRGLQAVDELVIQTPQGPVPLSHLVERRAQPRVGKITRSNAERSIDITANVAEGVQATAVTALIKRWVTTEADIPPGLKVRFSGSDEVAREASGFLGFAMIAALALMGVILLAQFGSFYQTFLILLSVIMGAVGAIFGLLVMERAFSTIMTGVGIVALAGIVVNTNIVLIDTYNRLVKEGFAPLESVIRTGAQRLRPILLTTGTTIIGLLPMALMINIDFFTGTIETGSPTAKAWVDLAVAVTWGLGISTIFTLVFTPAALTLSARRIEHKQQLLDHDKAEQLAPPLKAITKAPAE